MILSDYTNIPAKVSPMSFKKSPTFKILFIHSLHERARLGRHAVDTAPLSSSPPCPSRTQRSAEVIHDSETTI